MKSEDKVGVSEDSPSYGDEKDNVIRDTSSDPEYGTGETVETTKRGLKARHSQMIALGGTIGTGLFVSSGNTLAAGGPLFILMCYCLMSIMVLFIVSGIAECAAYLPVSGGTMSYYGHRNVSNSLGFAMGWLYFYSLGILVPYEITAAGLVIDYWNSPVNIAVWITIFIIVIVGLNTLPVQYYGETEFWFASLKVFMMIGLLILSFILFWGGGPNQNGILGFHNWKDPGATNTYLETGNTGRFVALIKVLVLSAFPFTFAPELLVVTGGEMQSPRRNLPRAAKRYIFRLVFFYIGSVLAIGIIAPFNDARLTDGGVGAKSSAFVVGIADAGISGLGSVINAIIITSAWSSGNSFLYMSSRSLYSLAVAGNAPKIFTKCTKYGVPYMAVAAATLFTPLAYLNCASSGSVVFGWFVNLTNTSGFISWICCCIVYLRFRKATVVQNLPREDIPYRSRVQPYGAWIAMVFFCFLTLINGFDVFWPENFNASSFLTAYVGIPIFLSIYFTHRVLHWSDKWMYPSHEIDLHTGIATVIANEIPEVGPVTWKKKLTGWFT
ncbi:putative proline-specific permease [Amylocarpus encephaloides]|uniref:Proline-specific permease n=1 Tax=Amylocarpus encephaloides TaxID=45428 RepID=A0A9P7YBD2_9HELO|nr:putative proline-specific permease [Amylocarpus encephaloides]